jgi:hypothetical protein
MVVVISEAAAMPLCNFLGCMRYLFVHLPQTAFGLLVPKADAPRSASTLKSA